MPEKTDFIALRCPSCGKLDVGPSSICRDCGAEPMGETRVPGTGRLVSWTVIRRAPTRFKGQAPYVVLVVELDCGLRVTGRGAGRAIACDPGEQPSTESESERSGIGSRTSASFSVGFSEFLAICDCPGGAGEGESLSTGAAMCCVGRDQEMVFFDLAKERQS